MRRIGAVASAPMPAMIQTHWQPKWMSRTGTADSKVAVFWIVLNPAKLGGWHRR